MAEGHEDQLRARLAEVKARIISIDEEHIDSYISPDSDVGVEYNSLNAEHDELVRTVAQRDQRRARIAEIAGTTPEATSATAGAGFNIGAPMSERDVYDLSTLRSTAARPTEMRSEMHDRAHRAIDRMVFPHDDADQAACKESVDRILANIDDEHGTVARRILVTGSPAYKDAFMKYIATGDESKFRADLNITTSGSGGFAVPVELDPTLIPTSSGVVNPYRQVSRIVQTTAKTWEGVTTAGVTATRDLETAEVADASPTLAQPTVTPGRVQVFIPFSISLQASWGSMAADVAALIQDAKDVEEVGSFTNGTAVAPSPNGLLNGATAVVATAATATFASADLDAVENALGARFRQRAIWMGNRTIYNKLRHFDSAGGPDLWLTLAQGLNQGGTAGLVLPVHGYPAYENSSMVTTTTSNSKILTLGDFGRYFIIVDKIGLNIELVPHLFGTANNFPTGQRGFLAYWFNNCQVLDQNAFKTLKVL